MRRSCRRPRGRQAFCVPSLCACGRSACGHMAPPDGPCPMQRLRRVRWWRQHLSQAEHEGWVSRGPLGPALRDITGPIYDPQLESELVFHQEGGEDPGSASPCIPRMPRGGGALATGELEAVLGSDGCMRLGGARLSGPMRVHPPPHQTPKFVSCPLEAVQGPWCTMR